jgi:hypothetical protein
MSLRDYFAAHALAGMVSNTSYLQALDEVAIDTTASLATNAYELADAMLRAREAEGR